MQGFNASCITIRNFVCLYCRTVIRSREKGRHTVPPAALSQFFIGGFMARMLSQVATIIRGSVGGLTYFKTRTQAIAMRARVAPSNFASNDRSTIRGAMAYASAAWDAMSEADRILWKLYADSVTYQGPTGPYTLTGRESFIASYSLGRYANQQGISSITLGDAPPDPIGRYNPDSPQLAAPTAAGTGFSITVTNDTGLDGVLLYQRSAGFKQTVNSFKGPWLPGSFSGLAMPTGASSTVDVVSLTEDSKYFVRLRAITDAEPLIISNEWILSVVAETTV